MVLTHFSRLEIPHLKNCRSFSITKFDRCHITIRFVDKDVLYKNLVFCLGYGRYVDSVGTQGRA